MTDQKLTNRGELEELPADGDLIHVVDVSDTTDSAEGTSKKWKILTWLKTLFAALSGATFTGDIKVNTTKYPLEGSTSRNIQRVISIYIVPGGTPNTNISIVLRDTSLGTWNAPSMDNATNLAKDATSGSWSLSADGKTITLDVPPAIVTCNGISMLAGRWNTAEAVPYYVFPLISGGNLAFQISRVGSGTALDWTAVMDANDTMSLMISFITST